MRLKQIALVFLALTISGCSLLQQSPREVEIITKPVKVDIVQPVLPRPIDLKEPKWYVVSEARIANPCKKVVQEDGTEKRPKACDKSETENPDWQEGYTYLDRFLDEMKKQNSQTQ